MDPNSDKSFTQQLAERLDNIFGTTKFSGSLDWINEKFGTQIDSIGHSIAKITDVTTVYIRAAYQTMADSVSNTGKIFGFLFNEFFQSNKGKIFAAIAAGLAIGYGGKSAAGALAALGAVGLAGLFGAATGEPSREELPDLIKEQQKKIQEFQKDRSVSLSSALEQRSKGGLFEQNLTSNQKELLQMHDNLERLKDISSRKNEEFDKLMNPQLANKFSGYVADAKANLPGGEYGGGYSPATRPSSMSPSSTSPTKVTFASLTKEQQDTVLQKQREREGFFPGSLTHDLNNPGAILYSEHAAKYGGVLDTTGRGVNAVKGKFAKFPTLEQGIEAQRALWLSSGYANLPLDQAINRWTTGKVEGTGEIGVENYKKSIFAAIEKIAPSSGPNLVQGSNTMAAMTRDMNVAQAPNVVVNAASAPVVSGKAPSAPVASATNVDALELFFKYAM
jgi:hypothetical protein